MQQRTTHPQPPQRRRPDLPGQGGSLADAVTGRHVVQEQVRKQRHGTPVNNFQQAEGRGFDYFTLPQTRSLRFNLSLTY